MDPNPPRPRDAISEDQLHALVDERLPQAQRSALEARLALDPNAAATRMAWQQQRAALRGLHRQLLEEPVPAPLASAARQAALGALAVDHWWRWGGMAAGVLAAFGLGWLSHGQYGPDTNARLATARPGTVAVSAREFARQGSVAHLVYAPEVRHPVEVTAAQQEHLLQWLSKRLERPLKLPNLATQGFELVGGRLLPGDQGARAQFMFQHASGERVTLYLGAMQSAAGAAGAVGGRPDPRETAFSFSSDGPVPGFYWVDQGFGYALAGNLSRERLMALAQEIYRQLA